MKGIILESAVPVRQESSDRSEMINQLLFGESYNVLEETDRWIKIESIHDSYKGWIDRKQHSELDRAEDSSTICYIDTFINHSTRGNVKVTPGALIPSAKVMAKFDFQSSNSEDDEDANVRNYAMKFMNAPYLWGGRTPLGIDCSGFTQLVYRMMGVVIPRDASQQVDEGGLVTFLDEAKEGDLAFFDNAAGAITHVGIILEEKGTKKIIHASGRVRIDKIDHQGIYNDEIRGYSHQLRTIKTIL